MDEEKKAIANRENYLYIGGTWKQWGVFNMVCLARDRKSMCVTICMYVHAYVMHRYARLLCNTV